MADEYEYDGLTSDDLGELLGQDFPVADDEIIDSQDVTPQPAESEITPSSQAEQGMGEQRQDWNPDGPGDLRVALQREREQTRQLAAQMAAIQQQQQMAAAQQQEQASLGALQARVNELAYEDPEAAVALIQQWQQAKAREVEHQAASTIANERAQMSINYARRALPDFDQQMARLHTLGDSVNWTAFEAAPDPAMAAYTWAQSNLAPDVESLKAQLRAEITAELSAKFTPKKSLAPRTLGSIPAAAPNDGDGPDINNLTKRDYDKHGLDLLKLL